MRDLGRREQKDVGMDEDQMDSVKSESNAPQSIPTHPLQTLAETPAAACINPRATSPLDPPDSPAARGYSKLRAPPWRAQWERSHRPSDPSRECQMVASQSAASRPSMRRRRSRSRSRPSS